MGAGKTTVGKILAEKLKRKFIDCDEEIEKEYGMSTSEVFKVFGEKAFRKREKSLITELCSYNNLVISLGGGAFLQKEIREICLTSSTIVYLDISFENWQDRLRLIIDTRPVLSGKTIEEMKELFTARKDIYTYHHLEINVDNKFPEEISNQILKCLGERQ
jgi:shikimate kinase